MQKFRLLPLGVLALLSAEWAGAFSVASYHSGSCNFPSTKVEDAVAQVSTVTTRMPSTSTVAVEREFNISRGKVRIVALLSPTCPGCRSGHAVVARVLRKFASPKLQAILIWEPMLSGDSPATAAQQARTIRDHRIWQGWNGSKNLGKLFGKTLGLQGIAWDVYLVYKPGVTWQGPLPLPPPPTFWMHQLSDADPSRLLCADPTRLSVEVGKLLGVSNQIVRRSEAGMKR